MNRTIPATVLAALASCACVSSPASPAPICEQSAFPSYNKRAGESIATSLRFLWTVNGQTREFPQYNGTVSLPLGTVAHLEVQGLDARGNIVPLSDQAFEDGGEFHRIGGLSSGAGVTHVYPLAVGPYDPVVLTADADSGPGETFIWGFVQVKVIE